MLKSEMARKIERLEKEISRLRKLEMEPGRETRDGKTYVARKMPMDDSQKLYLYEIAEKWVSDSDEYSGEPISTLFIDRLVDEILPGIHGLWICHFYDNFSGMNIVEVWPAIRIS